MENVPSVNVLVVGNNSSIKNKFIRYWLSLEDNETPSPYCKIIWMDSKPIQLCIEEISYSQIFETKKKYQSIIYLLSIMDEKESVEILDDKLINNVEKWSYKAVIEISFIELDFLPKETVIEKNNYYSQRKMGYYSTLLKINRDGKLYDIDNLQYIISILTQETCSHISELYFIDSFNTNKSLESFNKTIEPLEYTAYDPSRDPLLYDAFVGEKRSNNCCVII